jgi:hypothetical protein
LDEFGAGVLELTFTNVLWAAIAGAEIILVILRMFTPPGPQRLVMAIGIPALIIVGAIINAIYNRLTTGHVLDEPGPRRHHPS